jgi:hypothetical protein
MTTTTTPIDRAAINRRNAQKSTGPRTPEGKNRSRFNALKHGMTAKTLVLPDEDADVLQMRVETWIADLQPQNHVEQFLVEQAVHLSWKMERADRAEVAQLSRIIESAPIDEARRQQEVADALGYWLLSDRGAWAEPDLQDNVRNVLGSPSGSAKGSGRLDILDHPQAIVFRLESTAAGCRWLLDRWTELRARLETGQPWSRDQKVKALRLLGKRPPGEDDPLEWEDDLAEGDDSDDPESEAYFDKQLDQQLDERLPAKKPARIAALRTLADQAIGRLEALATDHRQRSEADAAQQAARLSFDASTEGERLRRYQFSCSRSLLRSLDTLIKVRRSGLGATSGEEGFTAEIAETAETKTERSDEEGFTAVIAETGETKTDPCSVFRVPCSVNPPVDRGNRQDEPPAPPGDCGNFQNEPTDPTVDRGDRQDEPPAPQVAATSRPRLPFHRALVIAVTLVVLFGAAVGSHRDSQNEPAAVSVDHRNRQNEPTAVSCHGAGISHAERVKYHSPGSRSAPWERFSPRQARPRPLEDRDKDFRNRPTPRWGNGCG